MPPTTLPSRIAGRSTRRSPFLFDFDWRDGLDASGVPIIRSGQTATFDRGGTVGTGSAVDKLGRVYVPGYKSPRYHHRYNSTTGIWDACGILLEGSRQNICTYPETFGTGWTVGGSPTLTAAAHTASGVSLDLIGDDDATAIEGYYKDITFTGDGLKAFSIVVKQGTSSSSLIWLRDISGGTFDRCRFVLTWSAGLPVLTTGGAGTYLGYDRLQDGAFKLLFQSSTITAANPHRFYIYPATTNALTVADVGTLYAGGVDIVNAAFPSQYIPNAASALTRSADAFSAGFNVPPGAMAIYLRFIELGNILAAGNTRLFSIGYGGAATAFTSIYSTGVYIAQNVHTAGSVSTAGTLTAPSFGDTVELLLRISQNGSIYLGESINLGNESVTASSAALAQDSAWSVPTFFFNALGASSSIGFAAFQRAIVAPGTSWSMAQLRAA